LSRHADDADGAPGTGGGRHTGLHGESALIEQGAPAPDFTLPDQEGDDVSLSDFRGSPVVLYFYPKADTLAS
jgi:cytochrome oxidase Cu insertion factor (SCO1/SenC/PrrC family)